MTINIILALLAAAIAFLGSYFSTELTVKEKIAGLIAEAATLDILGSEKMKIVVNKLYSIVPLPFRKILTQDRIQRAAQKIYDSMKEFAKTENK